MRKLLLALALGASPVTLVASAPPANATCVGDATADACVQDVSTDSGGTTTHKLVEVCLGEGDPTGTFSDATCVVAAEQSRPEMRSWTVEAESSLFSFQVAGQQEYYGAKQTNAADYNIGVYSYPGYCGYSTPVNSGLCPSSHFYDLPYLWDLLP